MASISDLTPEQFQSLMAAAFREASSTTTTGGAQKIGGGIKGMTQADVDTFIKLIKGSNTGMSSFNKFMSGQQKSLIDVTAKLKELDETIEQTTDTAKIADLQAKRRAVETAAAHENNKAVLFNFGVAVTKAAGNVTAGVGQFIKGLQGGGSGMDMATGLMTAGVDIATSATSAMGNAMGSAGQIMSTSANPKLKAFGAIASVAGPLLGAAGDAAGKLAKFGIEVLSKEVEKTVKAFSTATASGAVFADGMTGLRNAANSAGLTVDQFANVLGKHSTELAALGMGVTEGAKRVGGALEAGGPKMKTSLQKLGYSFEEQAELVAETMKDMKGSSTGKFAASDQQVAEQTQKYAENLRTISAITGEDAKAKMKQVNEQANQLAFQQKLSKMGPEQQAATKRAMANMSDIERKNFMDMVNFGSVINKEGAAAQAMSQGLTDSVSESYAAFQAGQLDDVKQREIAGRNAAQIKDDMLNNEAIAQAGAAGVGGLVQGLSESMGKELQFRNAWTEDAIKSGSEGVQAQKEANDKLTDSVIGAQTAAQDLKLALEKELTPAIGQFAKVAKEMLSGVQTMMKDAGIGKGPSNTQEEDANRSWMGKKWDSTKEWLAKPGNVSGTLNGAGAAVGTAGLVADATGVGAVAGVPMNIIGGVMMGLGTLAGAMGFAKGGVATGPDEGYLTKLHGNELIVPLTDDGGIEKGTQGFSAIAKMMGEAKMSSAGGTLDGVISSILGMGSGTSSTSSTSNAGKSVSDAMSSIGAMSMPGANDDILKEQTELLKQSVGHLQEMVSSLKDSVDGTNKLINVMS